MPSDNQVSLMLLLCIYARACHIKAYVYFLPASFGGEASSLGIYLDIANVRPDGQVVKSGDFIRLLCLVPKGADTKPIFECIHKQFADIRRFGARVLDPAIGALREIFLGIAHLPGDLVQAYDTAGPWFFLLD